MTSQTHRPPSLRALRAAIAAALYLPPWSVFWCARALPNLATLPPHRATASILLAVLCHALRGESNDPCPLLQRVQAAAAWRVRGRPIIKGRLPPSFQFLHLGVTLQAVLEILVAHAFTEDMRRYLQDPATNVIAPNAIEFGLHARRATLSIRLVSGIEWHGVFAAPDMPEIEHERLALRVSLKAPAFVELGRLCIGDVVAEQRIGIFAGDQPMIAEPIAPGPTQPRRSRRRPASQASNPNWTPDQ